MQEQLIVHAIQFSKEKAFHHRFRAYSTQKERDTAWEFMQNHLDAEQLNGRTPVRIRVIVQDVEKEQLELELEPINSQELQ